MRILGIETSGDTSSVALVEHGEVLAENIFASRQTICQLLAEQILATVGTETVQEAELDGIVVSIGPASFTGLRVGVTTAKAIAYCCHIPVIGISTPLAWAAEAPAEEGSIIVVLQPARRNKLYLTAFQQIADSWPRLQAKTQIVDVAEVQATVRRITAGHALLVTGNALLSEPGMRRALAAQASIAPLPHDSPKASTIACLGVGEMHQVVPDSYFTLRPHYSMVSQAERSLGVDLGP